jgi:uncharacterized membrane protein
VFAIALTLLVLEIHVPDLSSGARLGPVLHEIRPSFIAFLISFVVIAISWTSHRDLFALIRRTDRALVWLNIIYMFPLSMLPFGAALISRYNREPAAVHIYGLILIAIAVTRLAIWRYATARPHLLVAPIDQQSRRAGYVVVLVPAVAYIIGFAIAEWVPRVSLAVFAMVPVLYFLSTTIARSSAKPGAVERDFT